MALKGMIDRLFGKTRTIIGLDIGHHSVKAVELARSPNGLELVRYGIAEVKNGSKGDEGDQTAARLKALGEVFERSGIDPGAVCTSVSGESVIVRPIPMPRLAVKAEEEFELAVRGEAKDFIPFEMEDVIFDYQRLVEKAGKEGSAQGTEVLIVAVRRDLIDRHLAMVEAAGLEPLIVDVDSIALVNAVIAGSEINPAEAIAIVNIGSKVTNIAIMRNEMTRFTRDLAFGGEDITRSIASQFGVSFSEAEELKRRHGLSSLGAASGGTEAEAPDESLGVVQDLYQAIEDLKEEPEAETPKEDAAINEAVQQRQVSELSEQVIGDIVSEVKRSLLYYENQLDGEPITRLLLSGGTAKLKGLGPYFESVLDVPAQLVRPFEKIRSPFSDEEAQEKGPLLGVGLGLALRNVIES